MNSYTTIILAHGSASLYRTVLSVWMQDFPPSLLTLVCLASDLEKVQSNIDTVIQDTGKNSINVETVNLGASNVSEVIENITTPVFHLLPERDFLLPEFGSATNLFFCENPEKPSARHSYWQRTLNGDSYKVSKNSTKQKLIPISTLAFKTSDYVNVWDQSYSNSFEFEANNFENDWIEGGHCVVQSNRLSAFAPRGKSVN